MIGSFYAILAGVGYFFGKCIGDAAKRDIAAASYALNGRKERDELLRLARSIYGFENDEFLNRVKRHPVIYNSNRCDDLLGYTDFEVAVYQVALKEGWSYQTHPDVERCYLLQPKVQFTRDYTG